MRIARIIEYFPPHLGGMERHGLILSQEQIKLGHEVDVFIGFGDENLLPNIYKAPFQFLPIYSKIRRFWFNFWAAWQLKKYHAKNPYDIIHLHGDFIEARFGGKLSKKLNIPAVLTIHAGLNKKLVKLKNNRYFKDIKKIICVSEEIAGSLESMGVGRDKISVISSGIYLNEFKKENGETSDLRNEYSKPIIISVGVLRKNKGFGYLIDAFIEVKKSVGSATLLIIGSGPEEKSFKNQAKTSSDIYFLGRQEHDKIIEYLGAADIFALASISTAGDREGTPASLMEAMAAGLPIVATEVGGSSYLVKNNENGLIVEEKSSRALADAIVKLIENKDLAGTMSKRNLEDIRQKDWSLVAKKIMEIYPPPFKDSAPKFK